MENREKGPSGPGKRAAVPRAARYINTAIAIILCGLGIYHYTQPNQAWRSGTIELISTALLLAAAYVITGIPAVLIDIVVAVTLSGLGVRHIIIGGGWKSGAVEELFALLLVTAAALIYKNRSKPTVRQS